MTDPAPPPKSRQAARRELVDRSGRMQYCLQSHRSIGSNSKTMTTATVIGHSRWRSRIYSMTASRHDNLGAPHSFYTISATVDGGSIGLATSDLHVSQAGIPSDHPIT